MLVNYNVNEDNSFGNEESLEFLIHDPDFDYIKILILINGCILFKQGFTFPDEEFCLLMENIELNSYEDSRIKLVFNARNEVINNEGERVFHFRMDLFIDDKLLTRRKVF